MLQTRRLLLSAVLLGTIAAVTAEFALKEHPSQDALSSQLSLADVEEKLHVCQLMNQIASCHVLTS